MVFNLVIISFGSSCFLQSVELIVILLCTIYLSNSLAHILSPNLVYAPYRVYTRSLIYLVSRVYARIIDFQAQLKGNETRLINTHVQPASSNLTLSGSAQLQPVMTATGLQAEIARPTPLLQHLIQASPPLTVPNSSNIDSISDDDPDDEDM
jgi:hypothetical protein